MYLQFSAFTVVPVDDDGSPEVSTVTELQLLPVTTLLYDATLANGKAGDNVLINIQSLIVYVPNDVIFGCEERTTLPA
jgi:hypothetical protein